MGHKVVDHESGLPALDVDGVVRVLGLLPAYERNPLRVAASAFPLDNVPIQEIELCAYKPPELTDQGSQSSCSGHATKTAFEQAWIEAGFTMPPANFSPTYLYAWCNGWRDQGAVLSDLATALMLHGICTRAEAPEGVIFRQQYSQLADRVAAVYKPVSVLSVKTYDQLLACTVMNWPVVFGIQVGRNFSDMDSNGMCPLPDMVVGGHALVTRGITRHPQHGLVPKFRNSWNSQPWGIGGSGDALLRREHFSQQIDAFAVVAAKADDGEIPVAA